MKDRIFEKAMGLDFFKRKAEITLADGSKRTIRGIFDVGYSDDKIASRHIVKSQRPSFTCGVGDIADTSEGMRLSYEGVVYEIEAIVRDSEGLARLELSSVSTGDGLGEVDADWSK